MKNIRMKWNGTGMATTAARTRLRPGFTLVELLVVIAIVGSLIGLMLPAVQKVRESSRKTSCGNNVRQAALAVLGYESNRGRFPAGCDKMPAGAELPDGTLHAWSSFVLPFLEEASTFKRIDYAKAWDAAGGNLDAAKTLVGVYRCPSALLNYPGKADYGGISGAWIHGLAAGEPPASGMTSGLLIPVTKAKEFVRPGSVTDGMTQTLLVAESIDRGPAPGDPTDENDPVGRWAALNCFAQTEQTINTLKSDIRGVHPGGAQVAFGDARVVFLDEYTDPVVLSAICSRNGGEAAGLRSQ